MSIQAEKLEIMKLILETDNPGVLEIIKGLFKKNITTDFWETLSDEQKEDILLGISEVENGAVVDYDVFMKSYR
jgi:hypothetical protein